MNITTDIPQDDVPRLGRNIKLWPWIAIAASFPFIISYTEVRSDASGMHYRDYSALAAAVLLLVIAVIALLRRDPDDRKRARGQALAGLGLAGFRLLRGLGML
jgi:hypothetical protein